MKNDFKSNVSKWVTLTLVMIIVIGGLVLAWPTHRRNQLLKQRERELDARIEQMRAEIDRLTENQRRFRTDPDFVEMIARQNHRVYPGELVFVFDGDGDDR